jgi:hypothetical protein
MGAFDLIRRGAKGVKNAPFFSKADVVLDELQRGKGTGDEFLTELVKKGVKPTELKDRGLDKALKGKPKMTKAEVQKVFEQKAPPKVQEKVLTSEVTDYDEWLEAKAQEEYGVDWFDLSKDEKKKLDKMFSELPLTQYDKYKTPGGENYREILLKLPEMQNIQPPPDTSKWSVITKSTSPYSGARELQIRDEQNNLVGQRFGFQGSDSDAIREVLPAFLNWRARTQDQVNYRSSHYRDEPNLLAHIRVQDFKTPDGKKVLLVDEVQSDWHQEGRKKGYKTQEQPREATTVIDKDGYWEVRDQNNEFVTNIMGYQYPGADEAKILEVANARIRDDVPTQIKQSEQVPDAPFKKNWHELAMKRVLDYAAENGYDTVAITPGIQQVKRYEDATRQAVDEVAMYGDTLVGFKNGRKVISQPISSPDELEQYIGKDMAQKLSSAAPDMNFIRSIKGEDITVGGEGMKGFYDKILPDYLNNYGKKYGAQVVDVDLVTQPKRPDLSGLVRTAFPEMLPAESMRVHSFDITPQMREEIKTKGQPMYGKVAMPALEGLAAGSGAATMGSQMFDENNEQSVQNPVHFTENPDAMLLELMQRN